MGNELQNGVIERAPIKNSTHLNTCDYCDYSDICANTKAIYNKIGANLKMSKLLRACTRSLKTMPEWTTQQNDAINARGRNILVSAAAGSGKTAVLVEG